MNHFIQGIVFILEGHVTFSNWEFQWRLLRNWADGGRMLFFDILEAELIAPLMHALTI